nr:MAG TPA: hypothetical protein [Caudoviricetes sp.]
MYERKTVWHLPLRRCSIRGFNDKSYCVVLVEIR